MARSSLTLGGVRRALRKPPRELARRLVLEAGIELERARGPRRARRLGNVATLLRATSASTLDELWDRLLDRPFPAVTSPAEAVAIGDAERVLAEAERALERRVDLLGSGAVWLGRPIDWHVDFKSGLRWPPEPSRSIDFADLERSSDVKVPWELSRLQWLLPAGQAYLLTGEERYAHAVREVLEEWLDANPYAIGPNWIVAMEAALRIVSWSWLFHALGSSTSWRDPAFRARFLGGLYVHGCFVERNLERSDVNGNHYTADAAGLVFAGLFFGAGREPERWAARGWRILLDELPRQIGDDGVDFEASLSYHRLVTELFLLPALYRRALSLDVPAPYMERLALAGAFAAAYTRPDGSSPLWGDADDARVLPLGGNALGDHRYLAGLTGRPFAGPRSEVAWIAGAAAAAGPDAPDPGSRAFPTGGFYVMRGDGDHVFVDCGPVGLAGRGGHGHNDCLALEAVLDGAHLVSDAGCYVYTAAPDLRDRFRSTGVHSTPQVDGAEQNRFVPGSLWLLEDDAVPQVLLWETGPAVDRFRGSHGGYLRLHPPVRPIRTIELDRSKHALSIADELEGEGSHAVEIPLQLAPGVRAVPLEPGLLELHAGGRRFRLLWAASHEWRLALEVGVVAPSYGVRLDAVRLRWSRDGPLRPLHVSIAPTGSKRHA